MWPVALVIFIFLETFTLVPFLINFFEMKLTLAPLSTKNLAGSFAQASDKVTIGSLFFIFNSIDKLVEFEEFDWHEMSMEHKTLCLCFALFSFPDRAKSETRLCLSSCHHRRCSAKRLHSLHVFCFVLFYNPDFYSK